jgi:hypothetical protein
MRIASGEWRGADITITHPSDSLQCPKSLFLCSLQFAYPRVYFNHCTFNNPLAALSATRLEDYGTNSQNRGLHIIDPRDVQPEGVAYMAERGVEAGEIDPETWCIFSNITFDFCHLPTRVFGRNCEIVYEKPVMSRMLTLEEWRKWEAISAERGWPLAEPPADWKPSTIATGVMAKAGIGPATARGAVGRHTNRAERRRMAR